MASGFYQLARTKAVNPNPRLKITGATNATPIAITATAHGLATADVVAIVGVLGNTAANGVWTITVSDANTFTLNTSIGNGSYTADTGEVLLTDTLLKKNPNIIRWGTGTSGGGNRDYGDDIKACIVNVSGAGTLYTVDLATHEFLSDVAAGSILGTTAVFSSKTVNTSGPYVGGVLDAADVTFPSVVAGTTLEAVIIYKDTGTTSTSPLILYLDSASITTGLPVTSNGTDINLTWDNGTNRIAKI